MADAVDSKSTEGNLVRVRLSPRASFTPNDLGAPLPDTQRGISPRFCPSLGSSYPDNAGGQEAICELFSGERSWSYGPRSLLVNSEQSSVVGWGPRRSRQFQHRISEIPLVHDCISTEYWVKHLCFLLAKCRLHPPPINDSRC